MVEKLYVIAVAPHTGAWIETHMPVDKLNGRQVAPHTGAWIETDRRIYYLVPHLCRSPYGSVD